MIRCLGARDVGIQEVMHQILSLKLYRSSFQVSFHSLENIHRCKLSRYSITADKSHLEKYAERLKFWSHLKQINFVYFFANYEVVNEKRAKRKQPVVVRSFSY